MIEISIKEMLEAGVQFGHQKNRRHPRSTENILSEHQGVQVFDLEKTADKLAKALSFLQKMSNEGKVVLIVGTKFQVRNMVEDLGKSTNMPYISNRWLGGFLTNFEVMKKRITFYKDLMEKERTGELEKYTKKEQVVLRKKMTKLSAYLHGVKDMDRLPDVVLILDIVRDHIPTTEAIKMNIPTVGITDSDANPDKVTYPIPGNDDAVSSLQYFISKFEQVLKH